MVYDGRVIDMETGEVAGYSGFDPVAKTPGWTQRAARAEVLAADIPDDINVVVIRQRKRQ